MNSPSDPATIIGPASVKALTDAGYTLVPPKEPARIVTIEEVRAANEYACGFMGSRFTRWADLSPRSREIAHTADDWLVKTVNRRIVDNIRRDFTALAPWGFTDERCNNRAYLPDLRDLFCGEG